MSWTFNNERCIKHSDGHVIDLLEGTWKEPIEIKPRFAQNTDSRVLAKMMREGLEFAVNEKPNNKKLPPKPYRFPSKDRPILSIKRPVKTEQ